MKTVTTLEEEEGNVPKPGQQQKQALQVASCNEETLAYPLVGFQIEE